MSVESNRTTAQTAEQRLALALYARVLMCKALVEQIQDDRLRVSDRYEALALFKVALARRRMLAADLGIAHLSWCDQERVAFQLAQGVVVKHS